jgi:uncharacterized protein
MTTRRHLLHLGAVAMALLGYGPLAPAAEVAFGNILPDGPPLHKKVTSFRAARYTHIVEQHSDFSCGAAALATILRYAYGMDINEDQVARGMLKTGDPATIRKVGFSMLDMKNYLAGTGMRGRAYQIGLEQLRAIRVPCIVLIDFKGYRHFVVLRRILNGVVYLADPALGNRTLREEDFRRQWNGLVFAAIGPHFNRRTPLLLAIQPLSVRKRADAWRPLTDAELLDFGFTHKDLL